MKVSFTNLHSVFATKAQNFNSRVIYELSSSPLDSSIKNFIDTFEERFPKQSDGKRHVEKGYSNGGFTVFKTAAGESGQVFMVEPNYDKSIPKFVIKESFPLQYKYRADDDLGGIKHEYYALCEAAEASNNTQKPMGYVETADNGKFLLSKYMPNLSEVNAKTSPEGSRGV